MQHSHNWAPSISWGQEELEAATVQMLSACSETSAHEISNEKTKQNRPRNSIKTHKPQYSRDSDGVTHLILVPLTPKSAKDKSFNAQSP